MNHAKTFPTREAAEHSKLVLAGTHEAVEHQPCGGWHAERIAAVAAPQRRSAPNQETFPPAVLRLIDARDVDPVTGVRCCQRCGARTGLHRHHRRLKQAGGTSAKHSQCACNSVTLCYPCHIPWAHESGRAEATELGYVVLQSEPQPALVSVARFAAVPQIGWDERWPTCDGRWAG
jgi:hypothetical protein